VCLNNHNSFKFGAFGTIRGEKESKTLKLFFFLKKSLICLFPINIHDFEPKKAFFGQKQNKHGEKQTKSNYF